MSLRRTERSTEATRKHRLPECIPLCYSTSQWDRVIRPSYLHSLSKQTCTVHRTSAFQVSAPVDFATICTLLLYYAHSVALRCAEWSKITVYATGNKRNGNGHTCA